jgi:hypothetical protein
MSFKDILKAALANKNTQNHRTSSDTKRGRQLLAAMKNPQDVHNRGTASGAEPRDSRTTARGTIGKRDI